MREEKGQSGKEVVQSGHAHYWRPNLTSHPQFIALQLTPTHSFNSCFRFTLMYLRPTPPFHDRDMLALSETINSFKNTTLNFIKRLDLSHCSRAGRLPTLNVKGVRSSGGVAVGKVRKSEEGGGRNEGGDMLRQFHPHYNFH